MPFEDVLVHTGRPVRAEQVGPKVDGKPKVEDVQGTPFDCCLFLPAPGPESERQGKRVKRPTLMFGEFDRAGEPVPIGHHDTAIRADRVLVAAPELTGPDPVEWQVEGDPQRFGPPGEPIVGMQATLRRVDE